MREQTTLEALREHKREFWITQILVVISTVLGVFLAAEQGFSAAVRFDRVSRELSNYNLQKALRAELDDNVKAIEIFYAAHERGGVRQSDVIELDTFVWESMVENPIALELPTDILTATRRFYRDAGNTLGELAHLAESSKFKVVSGDLFRRTMVSASNRVELTKKELIPALDASIAKAAERLIEHGALEKER